MSGLRAEDLDYPLDPTCVADRPAEPRDAARLMVVERRTGAVHHAHVRDLPQWISAGDQLVVNTTRVLRARFVGARREPSGAPGRPAEGLLLEPRAASEWLALVRHARRFHAGDFIDLTAHDGTRAGDAIELLEREDEGWRIRLHAAGGASPLEAIERSGWTPLPPYILKARHDRHHAVEDDDDRGWYQTVYAVTGRASVAAPTAGLHFTRPLLDALAARGVGRLEVSLQVGAGTFKSVETDRLDDHPMHRERCHVPRATLAALAERERGAAPGRLVVVGTTTVRTLESLPRPLPRAAPEGWSTETQLLIQPGYEFRFVDALLTNFHLPRSTLLALVGAFVGLDRLKALYAGAQERGYRFFSYGDAMLIV